MRSLGRTERMKVSAEDDVGATDRRQQILLARDRPRFGELSLVTARVRPHVRRLGAGTSDDFGLQLPQQTASRTQPRGVGSNGEDAVT